jgi:ABC-2 type transport system ATP-binding protein
MTASQLAPTIAPGAGPDDAAVVVRDLVKRYPKASVNAVDGVSFTVAPGEVFGLLGPNGAGKTTTVGVLTTRATATAGHAMVGGIDVIADPVGARRQLAVVPQRNNLDRSLSIEQNLLFHARYHGVPAAERAERANALLAEFGLVDRKSEKPERFSGGQSQRVMIARALMHEPRVLFLDEPSTGLDPAARLFVWDRIRDLQQRGVTIVLTTHDMAEASTLADRVGIMDRGRLLALDTPDALTRSLPGSATLDVAAALGVAAYDGAAADIDPLLDDLRRLPGVERVERVVDESGVAGGIDGGTGGGGSARLRIFAATAAPRLVAPVAATLERHGAALTDVRIGAPSLEDVFIKLTGRALR